MKAYEQLRTVVTRLCQSAVINTSYPQEGAVHKIKYFLLLNM